MRVPKWGEWWHWPKDLVELGIRTAGAITVGAPGVVVKTPVTKPSSPPTIVTAPEEDKVLHDKYRDGDEVYYNLWWGNCNHFVCGNQGAGTGH